MSGSHSCVRAIQPSVESLEQRRLLASTALVFTENLTSNQASFNSRFADERVVNSWGAAVGADGLVYVANNGSATVTGINSNGQVENSFDVPGTGSAPTGLASNTRKAFVIRADGRARRANLLVAGADGTISAWNPDVNGGDPTQPIDRSSSDAVYTGLTVGTLNGKTYLYATDFSNGRIDVFDSNFNRVSSLSSKFLDSSIPDNYAPFNVQNVGGRLYVTYARPNADATDAIGGAGLGFIRIFKTNGTLFKRLASHGSLDAPWGMTQAPSGFGNLSGALLVANSGDGAISAFNRTTGTFLGRVLDQGGTTLTLDGVRGLAPRSSGSNLVYFASGPNGGADGLIGRMRFLRNDFSVTQPTGFPVNSTTMNSTTSTTDNLSNLFGTATPQVFQSQQTIGSPLSGLFS